MKLRVGVFRLSDPIYPYESPFDPSEAYPEYPFQNAISSTQNSVYEGVRDLFLRLGMDKEYQGESSWNPLCEIVKPGMTVAIKPNFVLSSHPEGKDIYSIITHPSVIRALIDYCWIALKGDGKIVVADAPQYDCDFDELVKTTRLDDVCHFYDGASGPSVEIRDLRSYWSRRRHFPSMIRSLPGDPEGTVTVNLGKKSALFGRPDPEKFYGAVYHRDEVISHHTGERQEYEISRTILSADAVISVPKMKVHKKVGVTLNTKGLVGICTNKNLCVHYTLGPPLAGGDQYPDDLFTPSESALINIERWMYDHLLAPRKRPLEYFHRAVYWIHDKSVKHLGLKVDQHKRLLDAGNWYGNDSAWRMAVDLLAIIYFADCQGNIHDVSQRRLFSMVDGVIGGENNGPLSPDPKPVGILAAGENLIAVDYVVTRLMGFDPNKIKIFSVLDEPAINFGIGSADEIELISNDERIQQCIANRDDRCFAFRPHPGWIGHIEPQEMNECQKS